MSHRSVNTFNLPDVPTHICVMLLKFDHIINNVTAKFKLVQTVIDSIFL